ncbi:tRNA pseudouridine(54/55) synthase Pus10 [Halodesulfurarchaeum formicicum]|uniref:tRNA pseudouridine synthase Pus10 n=1 Tax=Halodesulfurarchaeum formicicum TaxID=1873524 RepID=A0A1J1AA18_9EURY|nr:tRNA pseudouridine(54/55) synthase Pus10 [Halodesulfurarchaeum formicicum]APE94619.1 pseudouridylate synthase [Halodesulfurarchaeum formicicum]
MTLLRDAAAVLENGPVCDPCLGRPFADLSHGLTNAERGRALRVAVALDADEPFEPSEECWVCEGETAAFEDWADRAVEAIGDVEFETYQVGTRLPPLIEENETLLRELAGLDEAAGERLGSEMNREVGKRVGQQTGAEVDFGRPDVQLLLDVDAGTVDVTINSAFVYGRYRKLERGIPQTEWPCRECHGSGTRAGEPCVYCDGTGYQYPESVEQLTTPPVEAAMDGRDATFHGAGREDIDARMLGTGRPFVIEVAAPRERFPDVDALEAEINDFADGKVEVEGLRLATYESVERVKRLPASKTYRATVSFEEPITEDTLTAALEALDGATIEQETPTRVDHRRASKVRTRSVYAIEGDLDSPTEATVEIHGEGGLYVKELVSSDNGRTEPSLAGELGVSCHVTALDVLAVEGEDESFEDEAYFRTAPSPKS